MASPFFMQGCFDLIQFFYFQHIFPNGKILKY